MLPAQLPVQRGAWVGTWLGPGWRTSLGGSPAAQGEADAEDAEASGFGRTTPECAHGRVNPTTWLSPPADDALP